MIERVGVVVIGRNEGSRLRRCLEAACLGNVQVIYVDSGSTDGSVDLAIELGVELLELDPVRPFTAARARNEGVKRLVELMPDVALVQFVDGDCELDADWLGAAAVFMSDNPQVVAVCGRLRERHPEASVYNKLCEIEWDVPPGVSKACGGIAMFRVEEFFAAGGFREDLIAGEEPELCIRLQRKGGLIWRLEHDMATHDAAMLRFAQWWRRTVRWGHACALGASLHGSAPERHCVRERRRALAWGGGLPITVVLLAFFGGPKLLALFLLYPLQISRLAMRRKVGLGMSSWTYGFFQVLGRFPEMVGVLHFEFSRVFRRKVKIIEYK